MVIQEVTKMGVCMGRTQGMKIKKGLVQVLLQNQSSFHAILGFILLILGQFLYLLEENMVAMLVWHIQKKFGTLMLLFSQPEEEGAHALQSYIMVLKIEAQRQVGIRSQQMHVDQVAESSLHLDGIILMNLGAHG